MSLRIFALAPLFLFSSANAQQDARKLKINASRPIRIDYVSPSWNKDPNKSETTAIIIRDSNSGRMVKVEMSESNENSEMFEGMYHLGYNGSDKAEVTPEVYLPPQSMIKADGSIGNIETLIKDGTLLRKPYFLRTQKGVQILSVFDSREQALDAYQSFMKTGFGRPLIDSATFEAQRVAERQIENKARAEMAKKAEDARLKMEADERARQEELKRKQAELDAAEKAKRKAQAQASANEAMALYKKESYKEAEEKFNQAVELDPENTTYYFQYGVTLYRNENYNKALVVLPRAKGADINANERDYYIALSYLKTKEFEKSYVVLSSLEGKNDAVVSAPSAFYAGVIDFQQERYDDSKKHFEYVLDKSGDPKMDQQAENYIEQIANIKRFEELRKQKFVLAANLGLMYDSNILSVPAASAPTDLAGFRWSYGFSGEYRPIFSEKHELSAVLAYSDLYSTDTGFKAKSEFQDTDPQVIDVSLPYKWKGMLLDKPVQVGLTPTYENLRMVANGSRATITNSTILKGETTFVMSNDYFANYALEYRHDQSLLSDLTSINPEDDQTQNRISLSTTQTLFQDAKKTRAIIGEGAYAMSTANGDNNTNNRIDLAGSYLMPGYWDTVVIGRLGLGYANYPKHLVGRNDTAYSLTGVMMKNITADWSGTLTASFTKNQSSLDSYSYDKYLIMTGINWRKAF